MQKPISPLGPNLGPNLGPWPALGYVDSALDRAAERRVDPDFLAARLAEDRCGFYLVSGETIVLKAAGDPHDPCFTPLNSLRLRARTKASSSAF